MREQDSGNIVFYHSVSVLLLTASVFYSFLSHYQVAPQLHGNCRTNHQQWYTGTNSAHWSLQHCSAHCVVNASQCLVTIHILLVFTARQVSDFWLLILRRESRARLTESESGPKLRLRGPETRAGARGGSSALRVGSTGNRDWEMYPSEFLADVLT